MCNPPPVGLTKQRLRGRMQQDMVKGGGIVQKTLITALRSYVGYPRYRIHSIGIRRHNYSLNHPWFSLLDRQLLDRPRPLRTGSALDIF